MNGSELRAICRWFLTIYLALHLMQAVLTMVDNGKIDLIVPKIPGSHTTFLEGVKRLLDNGIVFHPCQADSCQESKAPSSDPLFNPESEEQLAGPSSSVGSGGG